ncbi:MAG: glycosyltransferase family 9 protein [Alphaproteobacteria bacterium]
MNGEVRRVLIYRLGSLGDTVVSLPCLHLVARVFPRAERRLLTNEPLGGKAAPAELVLGGSGLVTGTAIRYPAGTRRPSALFRLRREIRAFDPDLLVYLAESRGAAIALRDTAFFRTCGVGRIVGAPLSNDLATHRYLPREKRWEREAERLARCLAPLGDALPDRRESWNLRFTKAERGRADAALANWKGARSFLAFSVGTKWPENDWGDVRWSETLATLTASSPGLGLVLTGSADEAARSDALASYWKGPVLNPCGRLTPRESALVIARAHLFLGHDSGPMHLAAAVGTPAAAVFSRKNKPGIWFPHGPGHVPLYPAEGATVEPATLVSAVRNILARRLAHGAGGGA